MSFNNKLFSQDDVINSIHGVWVEEKEEGGVDESSALRQSEHR